MDLSLLSSLAKEAVGLGASQAETFYRRERTLELVTRKGELSETRQSLREAVSLRVVRERRLVHVSSEDVGEKALRAMVKDTVTHIERHPPIAVAELPVLAEPSPVVLRINDLGLASLPLERKIELAFMAETTANTVHTSLRPRGRGVYRERQRTTMLATATWSGSYDDMLYELESMAYAEADLEQYVSVCRAAGRAERTLLSAGRLGYFAATRARDFVTATVLPPGEMAVVFSGYTAGGRFLAEVLGPLLNGDLERAHGGMWTRSLGDAVAGSALSVSDDGIGSEGLTSTPFDDEGLPRRNTMLIEKGVFKRRLCNFETSRRIHLDPTASGWRSGVDEIPRTHPGDLRILPGRSGEEALLAETGAGLQVVDILEHSADLREDRYQATVMGYRIIGGKPGDPVKATLAGSLSGLLRGIDAVASEIPVRWFVGTVAVACPAFRVAKYRIV